MSLELHQIERTLRNIDNSLQREKGKGTRLRFLMLAEGLYQALSPWLEDGKSYKGVPISRHDEWAWGWKLIAHSPVSITEEA